MDEPRCDYHWHEGTIKELELERDAANLQNEMLMVERRQADEATESATKKLADVEKERDYAMGNVDLNHQLIRDNEELKRKVADVEKCAEKVKAAFKDALEEAYGYDRHLGYKIADMMDAAYKDWPMTDERDWTEELRKALSSLTTVGACDQAVVHGQFEANRRCKLFGPCDQCRARKMLAEYKAYRSSL